MKEKSLTDYSSLLVDVLNRWNCAHPSSSRALIGSAMLNSTNRVCSGRTSALCISIT